VTRWSRGGQPPRNAGASPRPARHRGRDEEVYHGARACEAIFARRPEAIVRVYVDAGRQRRFRPLLEWCARQRRGFQVVEAESLRRLTGSLHHEGVAILAKSRPRIEPGALLDAVAAGTVHGPMLYLDGVGNPHNLGSMLRTAAHFGAAAIIGRSGELPPLSPSAVRVAEGAAEVVPVVACEDSLPVLRQLAEAGWRIVTTHSDRGVALVEADIGPQPLFVLGSEDGGVSASVEQLALERVRIPGTGAVQSLNVAVACGVVLSEAWRRHPSPPPSGGSH
jgi:TrmH RNA methyltransferase